MAERITNPTPEQQASADVMVEIMGGGIAYPLVNGGTEWEPGPTTPEELAQAEQEAYAEHARRFPPAAAEIIARMSESARQAALEYVIEQGRYLESRPEWSREDNYSTTEGLAVVYATHVIPAETARR